MDAGDRWMLIDAAGKPMLAWDYNERQDDAGAFHQEHRLYATDYDALHRPVTQSIRIWSRPSGSGQDFTAQGRVQIERFDYQLRGVAGVQSVTTVAGRAKLYVAGNNEANPRWGALQRNGDGDLGSGLWRLGGSAEDGQESARR